MKYNLTMVLQDDASISDTILFMSKHLNKFNKINDTSFKLKEIPGTYNEIAIPLENLDESEKALAFLKEVDICVKEGTIDTFKEADVESEVLQESEEELCM